MKTTVLLTTILFLSTLVLFSSCYGAESVLTLTEKNFDSTISEADIILVEFYAPWCGHCKHLAPEFEKAAQTLKTNDPPVILAKVDATEEKSLGDRFSVQGYPTLYIFRKGSKQPTEYKGPRDAAGIISYMQKQAAPTITLLPDSSSLSTFKSSKGVSGPLILGIFSDKTSKLYQSFASIANTLREDYSFGLISSPSLISGATDNSIQIHKIDNSQITYDPSSHGLDLESFIHQNAFAIGSELTESNSKYFTSRNLPILKLYIPIDYSKPSSQKKILYYQRRLQKLKNVKNDEIVVTVVNKDTLKDPSSYGLTAVPEYLLVIEKGGQKYIAKTAGNSFNVEAVEKFIADFKAGKIESYVKSEEVEAPEAGKVVKVVGRNFEEIVEDSSKNVMIEFYAPWCGHCKTLAPIYDELAQKRSKRGGGKENETVIAKLDATANDWNKEKYSVNGFPTIFFKTKSGKIEQYNGERTVKAMDKFINSHAE